MRAATSAIVASVVLGLCGCPGAHEPSSTGARIGQVDVECATSSQSPQAVPVDFEALLANADKYDGALVRVRAFVVREKENQGLYRRARDADHMDPWDLCGVRLPRCNSFGGPPPQQAFWWEGEGIPNQCNRRWVLIEGVFDPCEEGHMDSYSGGLRDARVVRPAAP